MIIRFHGHYHGWLDTLLTGVEPGLGVPGLLKITTMFSAYGDLELLRRQMENCQPQLAAVIMEPVGLIWPEDGYLQAVRDLCNEFGALLIFDEIITGIRFNPTAAEKFGVYPDLMCLGKAAANGYPLAVLVGKREYMERLNQSEVFVSGTYAGELVSLAAAKQLKVTVSGKHRGYF